MTLHTNQCYSFQFKVTVYSIAHSPFGIGASETENILFKIIILLMCSLIRLNLEGLLLKLSRLNYK